MPFTTCFWGSAAVLLCAFLFQNCQSNSLSATKEEAPAASISASSMHHLVLSEPSAVVPLAVSPSCLVQPPSNKGELPIFPSARCLNPSESSLLASESNPLEDSKPPAKQRCVNVFPEYSNKRARDGEEAEPDDAMALLQFLPVSRRAATQEAAKEVCLVALEALGNVSKASPDCSLNGLSSRAVAKAKDREVRLLAPKIIKELEWENCVEKQSGDPLTILLGVAGSHPDKAIQLLEVLLVAAQDEYHRQQALEALGKVSKASPDMFSECLPRLRAAANAEDKDIRLLALKTLGEVEWKHYFGEVGPAPDLPRDIVTTLEACCPFWPECKIRDTHLLVLIPAQVDGKPFTLNLLGELVKVPKRGGSKTQYRYYASAVQSQVGNNTPAGSYWVLLTRDVLPGSRDKTYAAQKELVAGHASRTGLHYELPKVLEVATAILTHHVRTGERFYKKDNEPWTFTRCQELIRWGSSDYPSFVGGFESSGLLVSHDYYDNYIYDSVGVAGCRKFF